MFLNLGEYQFTGNGTLDVKTSEREISNNNENNVNGNNNNNNIEAIGRYEVDTIYRKCETTDYKKENEKINSNKYASEGEVGTNEDTKKRIRL